MAPKPRPPDRRPHFIGWECDDYSNAYVYRTTRVNRLIEMFDTGENVLVHPSKWDDPYDNWVHAMADHLAIPVAHRRSVFGQCWSLANNEEIHWKMYAPEKDGVMVRSTTSALAHALRGITDGTVVLGKVMYRTQQFLDQRSQIHALGDATGKLQFLGNRFCYPNALETNMQRPSELCVDHLFKRCEFAFECEVRLLYAPCNNPDRWDLQSYKIDPCKMIDQIVFDPRMSPGLAKVYEGFFRQHGFTGTIRQSSLYKLNMPKRAAKPSTTMPEGNVAPIPESAWRISSPRKEPLDLKKRETVLQIDTAHLGRVEILRNAIGGIEATWNNQTSGVGAGSSRQVWQALTKEELTARYQRDWPKFTAEQIADLVDVILSEDVGRLLPDDPFAWQAPEQPK